MLIFIFGAETFSIIFEILANKQRTLDESEELAYIFQEMIERNFITSINQVNLMIATCWKTRNLNGITSAFKALSESLKEWATLVDAFPDILKILDLAIETENAHC
jgi:hypothetical protein